MNGSNSLQRQTTTEDLNGQHGNGKPDAEKLKAADSWFAKVCELAAEIRSANPSWPYVAVYGRLKTLASNGTAPPPDFAEPATVDSALREAARRAVSDPEADPEATEEEEQPPIIRIEAGQIPEMIRAAENALLPHAAKRRIFQRSGEITRVVELDRAEKKDGVDRQAGAVVLRAANESNILKAFEELAKWVRFDERSGKDVVRDCPPKLAKRYLDDVGEWRLPVLRGVIEAPILKPSGWILNKPGFDPGTGLYFAADSPWPAIPLNPSRDEAKAALDALAEPFDQFPHVEKADRSVLVAAILTAIQRRLLQFAPLFVFSAPKYRSGKSLQAEAVGILATGRTPPAMAYSGNSEEVRKAILSLLRDGDSVTLLDNVDVPMRSADLARALTQDRYGDRKLGANENLKLSTRVTWLVTGNNPAFHKDLTVRVLESRIDANMQRPEERTFRITDLRAYLTSHRQRLVMAALTILRAWHVAGKPKQAVKPWGGFDQWSREIREPLVWLGMDDPCKTRERMVEADAENEATEALFEAWHTQFKNQSKPLADVLREASDVLRNQLRSIAADKNDAQNINAKRLGHWLSANADNVVGEYKLKKKKSGNKPAEWSVLKLGNG